MAKELFDHDYSRQWPNQEKFPINEDSQGFHVKEILRKDIQNSENFIIVTGFTSLSNLVETFGTTDYPRLKTTKIVIGFDIDDRVSRKLAHYSLQSEIKEYWLKQGVSIKLCGPILNIIEKIKRNEICFKEKKRLHAKIYVGDDFAILGSSNFSKSGLGIQREANIRVGRNNGPVEKSQFEAIKQIAVNYFDLSNDYNNEVIELFKKLLKDSTWEEALARAIAEILESKWMKDFPVLYQAIVNTELWPSQRIGIARAMGIIQDQGNVLLADPTGSGKTKFATTLAYTLFHWLGENGFKDRSTALVIAPKQVLENWDEENSRFNISNKIKSMGRLSNGKGKSIEKIQKEIEKADILLIDEAHNYLNWKSKRSLRIRPKRSTHIILSTATPINKRPDDLLRLIELLDIDNLSDSDLNDYIELRKRKNKSIDANHINKLRSYVNQFIVRRTKTELNKMIEREPNAYKNRNGHNCKYPKATPNIYAVEESEGDKVIAREIQKLLLQLKGIHYLQKLDFPPYIATADEKRQYLLQRFRSAPALAAFEIKSSLRSSHCALYEYLYGSDAALKQYKIASLKSKSGNIVGTIKRCTDNWPKIKIPHEFISADYSWILSEERYRSACEREREIYEQIGAFCLGLSGDREKGKARAILESVNRYGKILAFDSTVITLDYLKHLLGMEKSDIEIIVATGQNEKNKKLVRDNFALANNDASKKLIALCSDAMAEGINLPSAKAVILLDMPSVLRIIEQRIGRVERMDSEHKEIHVLWPDDSEEFSLNGDKRIIETLIFTGSLIGNNVDAPKEVYEKHLKYGIDFPKNIYEKHLKRELTTQNIIKAYEEYSVEDYEWQGVKDSTENLYSLIEGDNALIDDVTYNEFKDVEASVMTAISFVESDKSWSFFSFRGDSTRSPKWLFIDEADNTFTDFSVITEKLKLYLYKTKIIQRTWSDVDVSDEISKIMRKLRLLEKKLLPWKKKRALETAQRILKTLLEKTSRENEGRRKLIKKLISLFYPESNEESVIDYDHFAGVWLMSLQPALDAKRNSQLRRRKIISLRDLTYNDVVLDDERLLSIYESCQVATTLDEIIASCIISIKK